MEIRDAVVVLTGASAGIGEATAHELARQGAKLVLAARRSQRIEALAAELTAAGTNAIAVQTDMTDAAQVKALIAVTRERFGRIDVLINNAGIAAICPLEKMPDEPFRQMFELNVLGSLHAMQAVVPVMRAQGGGLIVNVSSMVTKVIWPSMGAYAATKFALNGLSETMRAEGRRDNIRVTSIFPDNTLTDFGSNALTHVDPPTLLPEGAEPRQDPPEYVAGRIAQAIRDEPAECRMG